MKLFASEHYVDEKIKISEKNILDYISTIKIETVDDSKVLIIKEFEKIKVEIKRICEENNALLQKDYISKLSDLKSGFLEFQTLFENLDMKISDVKTEIEQQNQKINDFKFDLDVLNHEKQDLTPVFEKIEGLDQSTLEHFKIVHDTMSKLSEIAMHKPILEKSDPRNPKESFFDRRLHKLDEKHSELASKVDAAIELIFEKLANKISDEELPSQLSGDRCPFKSKQGYCELWATRKNKADAMVYCSSCIQSSTLLDKGVRL